MVSERIEEENSIGGGNSSESTANSRDGGLFMKTSEIRYINFEIGVEGVSSLNNTFEIELPLTNKEEEQLISIGKREMWDKEGESWNYIKDFMPNLYNKFIAIVKPEAVKRYGEEAEGAWFEFFIPDEIEDKIWNSEEGAIFDKAKEQMQNNIRSFWKYDTKILVDEKEKGRWSDKSIEFNGIMNCGGMDGSHYLEINDSIRYEKNYTLKETVIKIEVRGDRDKSFKLLTQFISNSKYKNEYKMSIEESYYGNVLVTQGKNTEMDIELVMDFIDKI